ncbi:MAG: CoA transferase subunit A [Firmicutes bacterium]|jgi:glutaconate CoA-transferase subunit A|nr:CoA transferase subunit A [Bacillota bacterium]
MEPAINSYPDESFEDYSVSGDQVVTYKKAGERRLFTNPDIDEMREYFREHKSRRMTNKVTTVQEAVSRLIADGDYLAVGGFSTTRKPISVLHEIMRQKKRNLGYSGHTTTHDLQLLIAGKCINRCDAAYVVTLEARGFSLIMRKAFESGEVEVTEWTNGTLAWRFKAAAMGISFVPTRSLLGTDTLKYSAAVEMPCPFTGKKFAALPALFPDVGIIHVHRCDIYGNCQIDGLTMFDYDIARAAKKLIITTEEIIPNEEIRRRPHLTVIPYYYVDAVIEVPMGAYPTNMPYLYFSDEDYFAELIAAEKDEKAFKEHLDKYVYNVDNHWSFLQASGGLQRLSALRARETHRYEKGGY